MVEDTPPPSDRHVYPEVSDTPSEPVSFDWRARRQLFRQLNSPDSSWWADLGNVTAPTLVITGSANDDELEEETRRLPKGKPITIETGHWIHETQPETSVKTIRTFFEN